MQIQKLVADGALQLSLFDQTDLAEITHPDYPGERLVVCRNPLLAAERERKREDLMAAAEKKLDAIAAATRRPRRPLSDPARINYRIGEALGPKKVAKYFRWEITAAGLTYQRDPERIARDAALDGIYALRTSLPAPRLDAAQTVRSYKQLANLERVFRILKSVDLELRPIHHRLADRVRAHVLICLLAYYVEWHLRRTLAPLLFEDEQRGERSPPHLRSLPPNARLQPWPRRAPNAPPTTCPCRVFATCCATSPPSSKTASSPPSNPFHPSMSSPVPPHCKNAPLN